LNFGIGALTITIAGDVAATTASGIAAVNLYGTGVTVTTRGDTTVNGRDSGIAVYNYSGTATIIANGDVTGGQFGIRNLQPPTRQSTTTSTKTVTSTAATSSNRTVLPPWPSGVSWQPERLRPAPFAGPLRFV
jgi:hypothetical protein